MKIIIASENLGKIKEFKKLLPNDEVLPYTQLLDNFDIDESGTTFKENAIIKAKAIYEKLEDTKNIIVIADDSGISVPILNNEPGIYSARYARLNATDEENNQKLITQLKKLNLSSAPAFYTACIAMIYKDKIYTTHGWMFGNVIDKTLGNNGFGYDPMFIPEGFTQTLGELDYEIKKDFSHRTKAITLALFVLKNI